MYKHTAMSAAVSELLNKHVTTTCHCILLNVIEKVFDECAICQGEIRPMVCYVIFIIYVYNILMSFIALPSILRK